MAKQAALEVSGQLAEDLSLQLDHFNMLKKILVKMRGKKLLISIKPLEYQRSSAQNRWYWGIAVPTIRAWRKETEGVEYKADEIHAFNLMHVIGDKPEIRDIMGLQTVVFKTQGTSQMTTKEFSNFVEELVKYYAEYDLEIPLPKKHNVINEFLEDGK